MGASVITSMPRTIENIVKTRALAYEEVRKRQKLADRGVFNNHSRTCDIEQEIRVINSSTGKPVNMEHMIHVLNNNVRLDTSVDNLEYNANGVTPLTATGIQQLYVSFFDTTVKMQETIKRMDPDAILVPIGVQPFIDAREWKKFIVSSQASKARYETLDEVTKGENINSYMKVENPNTGETIIDSASNLSAMIRTSGTQFHISETSPFEALQAYNISIAIAPIMIAIFGNSPYLAGKDTGLASSRIEILRQCEQKRAGLPEPAFSIEDYYHKQLRKADPPFMEVYSSKKALDLSMGALHTVSRLIVDTDRNQIRNEFRHIDSQSPYKSIQAFLLTLGLIEKLRTTRLPEFSESQANFRESVWGLQATMHWYHKEVSVQNLGIWCVDAAQSAFENTEVSTISKRLLNPLKDEIAGGKIQADVMRNFIHNDVAGGKTLHDAIIQSLNRRNLEMLQFV